MYTFQYIYTGILLSHKKKLNFAICNNMGAPGGCFFFGHAHSMWKFLGQGSNLSHSSDKVKSLTIRPLGNSLGGYYGK